MLNKMILKSIINDNNILVLIYIYASRGIHSSWALWLNLVKKKKASPEKKFGNCRCTDLL